MARSFPLVTYGLLTGWPKRRTSTKLGRMVEAGDMADTERAALLALDAPPRPKGELLWIHVGAASAFRSARETYLKLNDERPNLWCLITYPHGMPCPDDARDDGIICQVAPNDGSGPVRRFLTHWKPDCVLWVGGGFRPKLIESAKRTGLTVISVDAPDSSSGLDVNVKVPGLRRSVLGMFDYAITSNDSAVAKWRTSGLARDRVLALGHLEDGTVVPPVDDHARAQLAEVIRNRPVWLASQTGPEEARHIAQAHRHALRHAHRLLLVVTLRDPDERNAMRDAFEECGLSTAVSPLSTELAETAQVLFAIEDDADDLWYRLAPLSFLGGSLSEIGGTDPFRAAALGSAMIHGPNFGPDSASYNRFANAGATIPVKNSVELGRAVETLLSPDKAAELANAAWMVSSEGAEATDYVTELVHEILDDRERHNR